MHIGLRTLSLCADLSYAAVDRLCFWRLILCLDRQVKPGTMYRDLGKAIEKTAAKTGLSVVRTYCGHGIGTLFHTAPNVPHYAKNKAKVCPEAF